MAAFLFFFFLVWFTYLLVLDIKCSRAGWQRGGVTVLKQKTSTCLIRDLQWYLSNGENWWELRLQTGEREKLFCAEVLNMEKSL